MDGVTLTEDPPLTDQDLLDILVAQAQQLERAEILRELEGLGAWYEAPYASDRLVRLGQVVDLILARQPDPTESTVQP